MYHHIQLQWLVLVQYAAICQGAEKIMSGVANTVVAGGCETFSDLPIRLSKPLRHKLLRGQKIFKQGLGKTLPYMFQGFTMKHLVPETPSIANFITGEIMGHSSDRLSAKFGVSRQEQDHMLFVLIHWHIMRTCKRSLQR